MKYSYLNWKSYKHSLKVKYENESDFQIKFVNSIEVRGGNVAKNKSLILHVFYL